MSPLFLLIHPYPLSTFRTRIAPTPSGLLHLGNGVSFIVTWVLARANNGEVFLRIDDLDAERSRPEYVVDIFETLEWLGLDYDEGPSGPDDFYANYSQQLRLEQYQDTLNKLRTKGHLFACTCSRRQINEQSEDGRYPGTCRDQALDWWAPQTAWRVRVPDEVEVSFREWRQGRSCISPGQEMGDFVLRQKNERPAYQLASLLDDLQWNINFIVRGQDLLSSTGAQIYLAELLNETAFTEATFWHHPLLTDESGEKLSKSKMSTALKARREMGEGPQALYLEAAKWLDLHAEAGVSLEALVSSVRERG